MFRRGRLPSLQGSPSVFRQSSVYGRLVPPRREQYRVVPTPTWVFGVQWLAALLHSLPARIPRCDNPRWTKCQGTDHMRSSWWFDVGGETGHVGTLPDTPTPG